MSPIERFKDAYANWRYNPFTGADMAVDKQEDNLYIPGSSPFLIQLLEVPRKDDPSTVSVYCYDDTTNFTEVSGSPAQGQFRVDYPPADGEGTGLIEFNQNDTGKKVKIDYKATGSPALEEFLDTKVSYPAGDPENNQIIGFVSGAPDWRNNPIRYFHEGPVIYHASGESESCLLFRFKKSAKEAKTFLELKGAKLHQGYYTELKEHNHGVGTLSTSTTPNHTHAEGTLSISGSTGDQDTSHHHSIDFNSGDSYKVGLGVWEYNHTGPSQDRSQHYHPVSGDSGNQSASHKHGAGTLAISGNVAATGSHNHTLSGNTANAGGSPKTYPDQLKIYINGTDKTTEILAKTSLSKFGDGTGSHAFVTTGSGEMDISDLITSNQIHEIKVTEPTSGKGGRCLLHLELY
jgi:hypothetical protein